MKKNVEHITLKLVDANMLVNLADGGYVGKDKFDAKDSGGNPPPAEGDTSKMSYPFIISNKESLTFTP